MAVYPEDWRICPHAWRNFPDLQQEEFWVALSPVSAAPIFTCFSPSSVVTLGVPTVGVKGRCLIEVFASRRPAKFVTIYTTFMPLEMHFDCAGSQNLGGRGGRLSRLRSRCGHGGHFPLQAQGKPRVLVVQNQLFVSGAVDAVVLLRFDV